MAADAIEMRPPPIFFSRARISQVREISMALGPFHVAEKLRATEGMRGIALFMRHGETPWNREGRVMGRNPVELDADGRAQVEAAIPFARLLKPELIITSPLIRARQSAEIVAAGIGGVAVSEDPQLAEVQYGRWEGMVYDDLVDDPEYAKYRVDPLTLPTPGGETIVQVQSRGVEAVRRAIAANPGRRILFVSHGDIIRTVLCKLMGLELEHFRRIRVDNATFSGVQLVGDFAEVKFLNLLPDPERAFVTPFKQG
jgi:phosphoserine phosphatase